MKTRVNVYLSKESLELADQLAKEQGVSRSAIIDRRITQTQTLRVDTNTNTNTITNTPVNHPDGLIQQIADKLEEFWQKLDKSLVEDRQVIQQELKEDRQFLTVLIKKTTRVETDE